MNIAFVTGSTGLLGSNLVRLLLAEGWHVKALARSASKAKSQFADLQSPRLEPIIGDLSAPATYSQHLSGVDVLFHTAAYFRESYQGGTHDNALVKVNVEGTLQLLRAAAAAGVSRAVHTSSIATLRNVSGTTLQEDDLAEPDQAVDAYYRSKILSDQAVVQFADQHPSMSIFTVIPGWMHGPGDEGPTSAGQYIRDFLQRKLPGVVDASFSVVDARDVARVMVAASTRGTAGRRYLAAGRSMHMRDLMTVTAQVSGIPAPTRRLPRALLTSIAFVQEIYARLTGRPVLVSLATVRNIQRDRLRRFSSQRIREELDIEFRPLEDTVRDAVDWHRRRLAQHHGS
jgi:dihydroflavonol-4-reductase